MDPKALQGVLLWLGADSLYILSNAAKPSPWRKLFLFPITGLLIYAFCFTVVEVGSPLGDFGVGSRLMAVWLSASADILLSEPQRELRLLGDSRDEVSERPFKQRLWWSFTLWGSARGVGWSHEPRNGVIPPRVLKEDMSRRDFIKRQLWSICLDVLLLDVNMMINRANPFYNIHPPPVSGFQHLWRLYACGYGFIIRQMLSIEYKGLSIVVVGMGYTRPEDWPPAFGSFSDAYTLKRLWG